MPESTDQISTRQQLQALMRVAKWRPKFTAGLILFGGAVALLEGIGLTFIYPIIEVAQAEGPIEGTDAVMGLFLDVYEVLGIPFELGYLMIGVAMVMTLRFTSAFISQWLSAILQYRYEDHMRTRAFETALQAKTAYFDAEGSDDILNAIITETRYAGRVIATGVKVMQTSALAMMYLAVMLYIAPWMSLLAILLLAGITILIRRVIEPAVTIGSRVAESNERVQEAVQAGTQGIRDVKLFGLADEMFESFRDSIQEYVLASIRLNRNEAAVQNGYELSAALTLFMLIYVGFTFTGLSLGALGIFLFAMFQLAPLATRLNKNVYRMEGRLSHLVRTYEFVDEMEGRTESGGDRNPNEISAIAFKDVAFSYNDEEQVLKDISFQVEKGQFVAFVGQSGAGKSTIVSLLARLYDPNRGEIIANGVSIDKYDIDAWRERIALVRQQPYMFNDTLERNVTIGNRDASRSEVERVCEIAKVTEFLDSLPNGYDSQIGDDGVRLSGGQRQRVSLARALLKDADFLLLDEATSDLDSNLEREVQRSIESMDQEYGIIAIAHRLSTVGNADVIHTVEKGQITESGTHEELVDSGGKYAELYDIQG